MGEIGRIYNIAKGKKQGQGYDEYVNNISVLQ